jgi:hypothetical protein
MMIGLGPRLRLALLCARIEPDADGLPFSLERPIHTLRFPLGQLKDYRPRELCLYTQLENATGSFHFGLSCGTKRTKR